MRRPIRLPSTTALLALESVARHLNIRLAAEEMHLTPGAVAQQIHRLEAFLDVKLLARRGRGTVLTSEAQTFLIHVRQAIRLIESGMDAVSGAPRSQATIVISVLPALASRWLIPRLAALHEACPSVEILLKASSEIVEPGRGQIDAAIRYGRGPYAGFNSQLLVTEKLVPVCSPAYLQSVQFRTPGDLTRCVLLVNTRQPWTRWLAAANLDADSMTFGDRFDDSGHVLDAAIAGRGVALARLTLAQDDLRSGKLKTLFPAPLVSDNTYHFVTALEPRREIREALQQVAEWLLEAFTATLDLPINATKP